MIISYTQICVLICQLLALNEITKGRFVKSAMILAIFSFLFLLSLIIDSSKIGIPTLIISAIISATIFVYKNYIKNWQIWTSTAIIAFGISVFYLAYLLKLSKTQELCSIVAIYLIASSLAIIARQLPFCTPIFYQFKYRPLILLFCKICIICFAIMYFIWQENWVYFILLTVFFFTSFTLILGYQSHDLQNLFLQKLVLAALILTMINFEIRNIFQLASCAISMSFLFNIMIRLYATEGMKLWTVYIRCIFPVYKLEASINYTNMQTLLSALYSAKSVTIIPGQGLISAAGERELLQLILLLQNRQTNVKLYLHPVAGHVSGYMYSVLCELGLQELLVNHDQIKADLTLALGTGDIINETVLDCEILPNFDLAEISNIFIIKRTNSDGKSKITNKLYKKSSAKLLLLDAKKFLILANKYLS